MSGGHLASGSATGWRAPILRHFTPEIAAAARLTIVGDPDQLLTEQVMLGKLRARGFDLVPFDDHVAFRFAYESRYRQIRDRGARTNLVVVLRSASGDLDALPYDLLERAQRQDRCFSFSVGELFPRLAPTVVLGLDRGHFDALFAAQAVEDSARLGVNATRDFVLRHAFQTDPELIRPPSRLLQVLLRRHYRRVAFPPDLDQRFMQRLTESGRWADWPLDEIVPNGGAFLAFLEERWPRFVKRAVEAREDSVVESAAVHLRVGADADRGVASGDLRRNGNRCSLPAVWTGRRRRAGGGGGSGRNAGRHQRRSGTSRCSMEAFAGGLGPAAAVTRRSGCCSGPGSTCRPTCVRFGTMKSGCSQPPLPESAWLCIGLPRLQPPDEIHRDGVGEFAPRVAADDGRGGPGDPAPG